MSSVNIVISGDVTSTASATASLRGALSPAELAVFLRRRVDPWFDMRIESAFGRENSMTGAVWLPLAASTNNFRARQGFPREHPINQRTGAMKDQLMQPGTVGTSAGGTQLTRPRKGGITKEMERKIKTAQEGDAARNTPPRPILDLDQTDLRAVEDLLVDYIYNAVSSSRLTGSGAGFGYVSPFS